MLRCGRQGVNDRQLSPYLTIRLRNGSAVRSLACYYLDPPSRGQDCLRGGAIRPEWGEDQGPAERYSPSLPSVSSGEEALAFAETEKHRILGGVIRFGGHVPKGGYDVPNTQEQSRSASAPAVR